MSKKSPPNHLPGQYCSMKPDEYVGGFSNSEHSYVVKKKLGKGHYSTVWLAQKSGKNYAIKIFRSSSYYREVFDNELSIMEQVKRLSKDPDSRYVAEFCEAFSHMKFYYDREGICRETSLHPCFSMPVYGESIADLLDSDDFYSTALPLPAAKNIMRQLLRGLNFLHKNKIIHTDINTANILMRKPVKDVKHSIDIEIVISDLGTACRADEEFDGCTGTKEYFSPEQRLEIKYDTSTDIWSAGCVFYELVTNSILFDFSSGSDESTSAETYKCACSDEECADRDCRGCDKCGDIGPEDDKMDLDNNENSKGGNISSSSFESDEDSYGDPIEEWDEGYRHFIIMEGILGPAPPEITKNARQFFNKHGKLKNNPEITRINIMDILRKEFEYTEEEIKGITQLLYCMIQYNPSGRSTAAELLNNQFLASMSAKKKAGKNKQKRQGGK